MGFTQRSYLASSVILLCETPPDQMIAERNLHFKRARKPAAIPAEHVLIWLGLISCSVLESPFETIIL